MAERIRIEALDRVITMTHRVMQIDHLMVRIKAKNRAALVAYKRMYYKYGLLSRRVRNRKGRYWARITIEYNQKIVNLDKLANKLYYGRNSLDLPSIHKPIKFKGIEWQKK